MAKTKKEAMENENSQNKPKEVRTTSIELRDPNARLNLTTKSGMKVKWTLPEALLDYNFKQLSEKTQHALTNGKSATQLLAESEK